MSRPPSEMRHWQLGKPLSADQNRALARQYRDGDAAERQAARDAMIRGNQALVWEQARRFRHSRLPIEDRMQAGNLGLIRAIEKYDPDREKFSTYAPDQIRAAIQHADRTQGRTIRIPAWFYDPTKRKRARESNVAAANSVLAVGSLDERLPGGERLGDFVSEREQEGPIGEHALAVVRDAVERLPKRERTVIRLRYGFDGEPVSLCHIGSAIGGVKRERVRQLYHEAAAKLRQMPRLMEIAS